MHTCSDRNKVQEHHCCSYAYKIIAKMKSYLFTCNLLFQNSNLRLKRREKSKTIVVIPICHLLKIFQHQTQRNTSQCSCQCQCSSLHNRISFKTMAHLKRLSDDLVGWKIYHEQCKTALKSVPNSCTPSRRNLSSSGVNNKSSIKAMHWTSMMIS